MPVRWRRFGRTAAWALSLAVHILVLGVIVLLPARRLTPPSVVDIRLLPPPDHFQPNLSVARTSVPASDARALPRGAPPPAAVPAPLSVQSAPILAQSPAKTEAATAPTVGASPAPAATAAPEVSAGPGLSAAALNTLRQSLGCSAPQRKTLTPAQQAECDGRAGQRANLAPREELSAVPAYKRDHFDQVVAIWASPSHIPGTDCIHNIRVVTPPGPAPNLPDRPTTVSVPLLAPVTCVPPLGPSPKPKPQTLQDLGLAR